MDQLLGDQLWEDGEVGRVQPGRLGAGVDRWKSNETNRSVEVLRALYDPQLGTIEVAILSVIFCLAVIGNGFVLLLLLTGRFVCGAFSFWIYADF